jgi:hypothetical protein
MGSYHVETYSLVHVVDNPALFNTNNHGEAPTDYREVVDRTNTSQWIDLFHDDYSTITIDETDVAWMREAARVGAVTRRFTHLFDDELALACAKYQGLMNAVERPGPGWFVRSEHVSLKEGEFGAGPYQTIDRIVRSMVSTTPGHTPLPSSGPCTLYLMPWIPMDRDREFRVFVRGNRVTAVSQQHVYRINEWLVSTPGAVDRATRKILDHFASRVRDRLAHLHDYTMDVALVGDDEAPYFIEPNSFGAAYAAGSALFHWIRDHEVLHGDRPVEVRYVDRE